MMDGITLFLLETEMPLYLSEWAVEVSQQNINAKKAAKKGGAKI